jgi:hypothetical protein
MVGGGGGGSYKMEWIDACWLYCDRKVEKEGKKEESLCVFSIEEEKRALNAK